MPKQIEILKIRPVILSFLNQNLYFFSYIGTILSYVSIINGGNTEIQIKRKDFDQRNYNKPDEEKVKMIIKEKLDAYPKEKLTKWGDVTKNLMAILGFIGLIISIIKTSGL